MLSQRASIFGRGFLKRSLSRAYFSTSASRRNLPDGDLRSVRGMFDLKGGNYVLTGGGRGIGYACTRAIAEMGGNVAVLDVLDSPVKDFGSLEPEFGVKARYIHADVTDEK